MSSYDTAPVPAQTQATSLNDRLTYARELAQSGLLPSVYRGKPANMLVAIETGQMLGVAPMAAVLGIYVIDGQPAYKAGFIAAMVRRAGHRMRTWWDPERKTAVTTITRSDDAEFEYRSEWDLARAQRARLVQLRDDGNPYKRDRSGNPLPWETYPENLLKARTISECARDACEELFYGAVYVPEELGAQVDPEGTPMIVEQQSDPLEDAKESVAQRVDWDADLEALEGNRDGLRNLWALANQYRTDQLPEDYMERVMAAGARAAADAAEADDTIDPNGDHPACDGSRQQPEGDMTVTGENGVVFGMCPGCKAWVPLTEQQERVLDHARQDNQGNGGDE